MTLGEKLAALRRDKGLTQEELAEMLAVSHQSVSRWERNAALPETAKLLALRALYGCSLDELFGLAAPGEASQAVRTSAIPGKTFQPEPRSVIPGASCLLENPAAAKGGVSMLYASVQAASSASYGVYHGEHATLVLTAYFCQAFLRLSDHELLCVMHHPTQGPVAVVEGLGKGWAAHAVWCYRTAPTASFHMNAQTEEEAAACRALLTDRDGDMLSFQGTALTYRMADGRTFPLQLAEAIDMAYFRQTVSPGDYTTLPDRMRAWNRCCLFHMDEQGVHANLSLPVHNFCFNLTSGGDVYCRAGLNGYTEKGWAMLSTACLRPGESRMLPNNLDALTPFQPLEDAFVPHACAFPEDGGWYWSIKDANDDVIHLHGCGGDTYAIYRPRSC